MSIPCAYVGCRNMSDGRWTIQADDGKAYPACGTHAHRGTTVSITAVKGKVLVGRSLDRLEQRLRDARDRAAEKLGADGPTADYTAGKHMALSYALSMLREEREHVPEPDDTVVGRIPQRR